MTTDSDIHELAEPLRELRSHFEALVEPHRPSLWRYCLRLTGSAWEAEDLVQETLLKAFARLPNFWQPLNARAYLFRIASNAWIDTLRRTRREVDDLDEVLAVPADLAADPAEARDAIERLVLVLPPRQRVVWLLTEAFDFRAAEVAAMIGTTEGAVKAALHRARVTLRNTAEDGVEPEGRRAESPDPNVLAAYLDAFNRRDPDAIAALLDERVAVDIVGAGEEHGREVARQSSLAEWAADPTPQWAEAGELEGRPVVLVFERTEAHERALSWISTLETAGGRITRQRLYYFCPEIIEHTAAVLSVPTVTHGYRYLPPESAATAGA